MPQIYKPTKKPHEGKPNIDMKVNEASRYKGKEELINDENEEEVLSASEKLVRKKRYKVLNDIQSLCEELEAKEKDSEIANITLATQKSLFPL